MRSRGIATLIICILEISLIVCQQSDSIDTETSDLGDPRYKDKISTINRQRLNSNKSSELNEKLNFSKSDTVAEQNSLNGSIKRLRKHRRGKKKNGKRRKGLATAITEHPLIDPNGNQTQVNPKMKNMKKKRKPKRKRNRKNRRKQKPDSNNILEITTAKEMIFSTNTHANSTINELIRKLNENPEDNFEEFRLMHSNSSITDNTEKNRAENLVAPISANSELIPSFYDNITIHVNIDNGTNYKTPIKRYNRCRKKKGGCSHFCNPKGKMKCSCFKGFALAPDERNCLDIDECQASNGGCEKDCHNSLGSYECQCPIGLRLSDNMKSCTDINECLLRNGHGPCQDTCENTFGSFKCSCTGLNGTVLSENGYSCIDIDECASGNGECSHDCINAFGKAFCSCPSGMELSSDWKTCQDINECEDDSIREFCNNCINTEGSYHCIDTIDYQSDQPSPKMTCKPLSLPPLGFLSCSRDDALKSYSKTGRERITNSPGTVCKLVCPDGYRMIGQFYVACSSSGKWEGKTKAKCIRVRPPTISCPPDQYFIVDPITEKAMIQFPSPRTNINWKHVKSYPSWAKDLNVTLKLGHYVINFVARDPNSKLYASCTFKIIVEN